MLVLDPLFIALSTLSFRLYIIYFTKLRKPKSDFLFFIFKLFILLIGFTIFTDKVAVKEIAKVASQGFSNTFILYYVIGFPFLEIGVSPRAVMVSINFCLLYLLGLQLYGIACSKNKESKRAQFIYILVMFYPDLIYFGFFSLRDIGLSVLMCILVICLINKSYKLSFLCFLAIFFTRPELVIWLILIYTIVLFKLIKTLEMRMLGIVFLFFVLIFSANFLFFRFLEFNHWSLNSLTIIDALNFLMENRYQRQFSDSDGSGSTSPTIPEWLFYDLNLYSKVILQMMSFLYVSLEPGTILIGFAVLTGIYPALLLKRIMFRKFYHKGLLLLAAVSSYSVYGPFIVNGGNAFRLRIAFVLLVFTSIAYMINYQKSLNAKYNKSP